MFAVVANGIQAICKTQRQLDCIISIYPYPKFKKCSTEEEAREWLRWNSRKYTSLKHERYGNTSISGYARIEYFIDNVNTYYNIHTERVGYIRVQHESDIRVDSRRDLLKVKVLNSKLNNNLIMHHAIAIRRILRILGQYIDVDIVVPDISVFLALTKYNGNNYMIRGVQKDIATRLGAVSITVKE